MPNDRQANTTVPRESARDIQPSKGHVMTSIFTHYDEAHVLGINDAVPPDARRSLVEAAAANCSRSEITHRRGYGAVSTALLILTAAEGTCAAGGRQHHAAHEWILERHALQIVLEDGHCAGQLKRSGRLIGRLIMDG